MQSKVKRSYNFIGLKTLFFADNKFTVITLAAVCVLAYCPTLDNRFQNFWDDTWVVFNSYTEGGLTWQNIYLICTSFYHGQYAPVNEIFYLVIFNYAGYSPIWFHGLSLLIHTANVILVFIFIKQLLTISSHLNLHSIRRIAFFTALLFAVHPFLVESVAWISASKVVIYTFFYLFSLIGYLQYVKKKKLNYYLLAMIAFVMSFGAKEQAVTLPVCLVLLDYILKRNLKSRELWFEKVPFILLSLIFGYITMLSQAATGDGVLSKAAGYPFYQRIAFSAYSLTEYFFKCLIPYKLSYLYPFPNPIGSPMPSWFLIYPVAVICVVVLLWRFWKIRWIAFGMLFFIIHLAVVLHLVSISRFVIVADRYVYLASIGVFFVLAWLFDLSLSIKHRYRNVIAACATFYVLGLMAYTNLRVRDWYNTDTLKKEIRIILRQRKDFKP